MSVPACPTRAPHYLPNDIMLHKAGWVVPVPALVLARFPEGLSTLEQRASPMSGSCGDQLVPLCVPATDTSGGLPCGFNVFSHCARPTYLSLPLACSCFVLLAVYALYFMSLSPALGMSCFATIGPNIRQRLRGVRWCPNKHGPVTIRAHTCRSAGPLA